mmetsp:Transcript_11494/g.39249  ORF Transcript_11494/g.39249 Transcript_11494/m.39249 type:complete len:218 (-) Transcript_11494:221-874(-)
MAHLPITCTASISMMESPMEMRLVTASKLSVRCTCKKACTFQAWQSPGNSCSKAPRAEITSMGRVPRRAFTSGRQRPAECCTQPSVALVMMTALPCWQAMESREAETLSRALSCSLVDAGTPPKCCITSSMCVVAISVSSQSKMVTVCADFGRSSCGMKAREAPSLRMYARRKSSFARFCTCCSTADTTTSSSSPMVRRVDSIRLGVSCLVMPTFIR